MSETHRFSVSVAGAVIDDEGRFLCIKRRDNGHWELPGGVVEPGETLVEAVVREIREETGYSVTPGPVSGIYQNMERDIVSIVFRCEPASGSPCTSSESAEVRWLDAAAIESLMDEAYAVRLLDAYAAGHVPVRTHNGVQLT